MCPACRNVTLRSCYLCDCGVWFFPNHLDKQFCGKECAYRFRITGCKKGKHYPNTQRARIATCKVCGKEFRAVKDCVSRTAVFCFKECWSKRGRKKRVIKKDPLLLEWKLEVCRKVGFVCQLCGSTKQIEAHHIKEKRNFPELKYDVSNGMCLCHDCHVKTDNYGYKAVKKQKQRL